MRRAAPLLFLLTSLLVYFPTAAQQAPKSSEKDIKKFLYGAFKEVEKFGFIHVHLEGKDGEKIGVREEGLTDYLKLRFKNNFARIEYEDMSKRLLEIMQTEREARKTGYLWCQVWVVGDDYPVAYHIECTAGHFKDFRIWRSAHLGYGSKRNIPDTIMEEFAIDFFTARGAM